MYIITDDTEKINDYVTNDLMPVFGEFPQCIAQHEELFCGLLCDPRQSIWVVSSKANTTNNTSTFQSEGISPNMTDTFYMCESFCDLLFSACKEAPIGEEGRRSVEDFYDNMSIAFCLASMPYYLPRLAVSVVPDGEPIPGDESGQHRCFSGHKPLDPDPCQSFAFGSLLDEGGQVGANVTFYIQARSVYGNTIRHTSGLFSWLVNAISVTTGMATAANVTENFNGTFTVSFRVYEAGYYALDIYLVQPGIPPSKMCEQPENIPIFPALPDPSHFVAYGNGLLGGYENIPTTFFIQARDKYGNMIFEGGATLQFDMIGPNGAGLNFTVIDYKNGTYQVTYVPPLPGVYNLTIYASGQLIMNPNHNPIILPGTAHTRVIDLQWQDS